MSNNWSRLVASQSLAKHGQNMAFVTCDWGWNKNYIWIEHLLPAANFFKVILAHSLLSPSNLHDPDYCHRSTTAVLSVTNWQALGFSLFVSDRNTSFFNQLHPLFSFHIISHIPSTYTQGVFVKYFYLVTLKRVFPTLYLWMCESSVILTFLHFYTFLYANCHGQNGYLY